SSRQLLRSSWVASKSCDSSIGIMNRRDWNCAKRLGVRPVLWRFEMDAERKSGAAAHAIQDASRDSNGSWRLLITPAGLARADSAVRAPGCRLLTPLRFICLEL